MDKYIQVIRTVFHLFKNQRLNPLSQILGKIDRSSAPKERCAWSGWHQQILSHCKKEIITLEWKVQYKDINCQLDKVFKNNVLIKKFSEVTELLKKEIT